MAGGPHRSAISPVREPVIPNRVKSFLAEPDGHALGLIADLIEAGEVRVEVEQVLPLVDAAEAHRRLASGRTSGNLVLDVAA